MSRLYMQKSSSIKNLSKQLKGRIFGQNHIVDAVVDILYVNMAGLGDRNKPIASFLFTGPTGVGKTEFAIELANHLNLHFERFDMSEYADDSSYRNLIGGDKGLVGYEDGGLLTNAINQNPRSVLLFDEIEKADPSICNTLLQVFDYATLKDTKGKVTDFSKTIIIMTSNLGSNENRGIGFGENANIHSELAVANFLSPEFRNRLDKILKFNTLTGEMITPILEKFLEDLHMRLSTKNIILDISNGAKKHLINIGFEEKMGARSVKRIINNEFKKHIAKEILFGSLTNGGRIIVDIDEVGFTYKYISTDVSKTKNKLCGNLFECDFETAAEAHDYAKNNVGTIVVRSPSGSGYILM